MNTLNPQQLKAVNSKEPYILCLAGAGTGKTRTLTERIKRLINDGASPQDITAITFTKRAALEMKHRINIPGVFIDTFHAWCMKLLREYGHILGWNGDLLQIIDEEDQKLIMTGIKKNLGIKRSLNTTINEMQNNLFKGEYRSFCLSHDIIDYDMIQTETQTLLQMEYIRHSLGEHLLIDEFQDTDPVQYEIVSKLINAGYFHDVFVVADDAQSIYSFRGACPQNIQKFITDFDPEVIILDQNYRSGQIILDHANKIPVNSVKKTLWSEIPEGIVISREHMTIKDEVADVLANISGQFPCLDHRTGPNECTDCYNTGYIQDIPLYGTTVILARTNAYLDEYAFYLEQANIPFRRSRAEKWTPVEKIVINNMKALVTDNKVWIKGYDVSIIDNVETSAPQIIPIPEGTKLFDLHVQYLEICTMLCESYSHKGFLDFIETQRNEEVAEAEPGTIHLLTIHAAKGLEFDNVFLVGCGSGIFPLMSEREGEAYEEAKRLFYVACTRAKQNLFISWPRKYWSWGKELEITESGFIKEEL